jgi:hypothetical protein
MSKKADKRLINGHYVNREKIVAFCHLLAHRGYLTKEMVKYRDCLAKKCLSFEKLTPEHWKNLEIQEREKQNGRPGKGQMAKITGDRDTFIRQTLEQNGHIYVTSIRESYKCFKISYVYDKRVDLTTELYLLREKLKRPVKLTARVGSDEVIEQLIRKPRREKGKVTDLRKAPKVGDATKKRLAALGVYCLEDLFGRNGDALYRLDCKLSGGPVNRRYLTAYRSAVKFAYATCP